MKSFSEIVNSAKPWNHLEEAKSASTATSKLIHLSKVIQWNRLEVDDLIAIMAADGVRKMDILYVAYRGKDKTGALTYGFVWEDNRADDKELAYAVNTAHLSFGVNGISVETSGKPEAENMAYMTATKIAEKTKGYKK